MLIDASDTHYMDPDVMSLIRDFKDNRGPAHGVSVSSCGFREEFNLRDDIQYADSSTRELQERTSPKRVLDLLREGNQRFQSGDRLLRDYRRQIDATARQQTPLAVILSCIDSRVPAELIFDVGIGDIFSVRVAGNVLGSKSLASIEYGVGIAGVKLVLVLGHTRCGAITSSVQLVSNDQNAEQATGCQHLQAIVDEIVPCIDRSEAKRIAQSSEIEQESLVDDVAARNVLRTVQEMTARSAAIRQAVEDGETLVVGAMYDVKTGCVEFLFDKAPESHSTK